MKQCLLKTFLGEAGVVHINCTVSTAKIKAVSNTSVAVQVNTDKQGNSYNIQVLKEGMTTVTLSVDKGYCKFHSYQNAEEQAKIYVFKKPKTETSATTLTLYDDLRIFDDKPYKC